MRWDYPPIARGPDAYVTAHHLRDMLAEVSVEQLLEWSQEPGLLPRVPAGAARGRSWADLDEGALNAFAAERDIDVRFSAQVEMGRRGDAPSTQNEGSSHQAKLS